MDILVHNPYQPPLVSHRGTILFVLFFNFLLVSIKCNKVAYADNLKTYCSISCIDDCLNDLNECCKR